MAVQVIAYEIMVATGGEDRLREPRETPLATADELAHFFDHLERALTGAGFLNPANPRHLMLRLRRLFARAEPDSNEIAILRGILSALAPGDHRPADGRNEDTASK
jgi:tRNA C32,U32 (ribose-2'-O)-methylase TrmJ